ncbi:Small ubiquitin-related modifier 2 [Zea mays]|uniref:Small ubiquitin-related modifier 2 n=1 Tax=Zea mays TaxID=4577 RepID=A0A1D6G673_MAIZE|nr:Small ubiquitin-related modifier 2 [Zea mays]
MSGAGEEDKKPAEGGAHINLKVKGQDGNEVFFRIKRSTQLKKLMNAYCDRQSVDMNAIAFLFDGRRLRGEQTPDECSWRWRTATRSTPCFTRPEAAFLAPPKSSSCGASFCSPPCVVLNKREKVFLRNL